MRANECYRKCGRDETTKYYNMKSIIEKIEYRLKELNEKKKSIENETSFRVGKKLEIRIINVRIDELNKLLDDNS